MVGVDPATPACAARAGDGLIGGRSTDAEVDLDAVLSDRGRLDGAGSFWGVIDRPRLGDCHSMFAK